VSGYCRAVFYNPTNYVTVEFEVPGIFNWIYDQAFKGITYARNLLTCKEKAPTLTSEEKEPV